MGRALHPGARIGRYRVVGPLGAGGMGEVYLAQDLDLDRPVALKILPPQLVGNEDRLRRFVLEAKSASSLNHPNIVTIHEIGREAIRSDDADPAGAAVPDPVHFIAMEFVSGRTLADLIHHQKEDLKTLLGYLAQAAEGLAKAHGSGIVHRDLKPGNIMISKDGYTKVLDFGLAKLTERRVPGEAGSSAPTEMQERTGEGILLGTVGYMSPEQVQGKPVDHRSDIFSFGCILYEAATRQRPFRGDSSVETMHRILSEKPQPIEEVNPQAPAELRRIVRRCLAKTPEQRLQSMKDLAIELRDIVDEFDALSASATSASSAPSGRAVAMPASRPVLMGGMVAAAIVVLAAAGFVIFSRFARPGAPTRAAAHAGRVTVIPARGGNINGAALSRDGRYLARVSGPPGRMSLWVRQLATGSEIEILPPRQPSPFGLAFSPDGEYLYYLATDTENQYYNALFEVPSLGGAPRRRAHDVDTAVSFAPDGHQVVFRRGDGPHKKDHLVILDLANGKERILASIDQPRRFSAGPVWSPDGERIAVAVFSREGAMTSRLLAYEPKDGTESPIGSQDWGFVGSIAWRPSGDGLVMTAMARDSASIDPQIWDITYPEAQARPATNDLSRYSRISVSGDGHTIAAVRDQRLSNLWMEPADGKARPHAITFQSSNENTVMGYDPAGNDAVVFVARDDVYSRVWRVGDDGTGLRRITSSPSHAAFPRAQPDGGIVFAQLGEDRRIHLWRMDPSAEEPRRLTDGAGELLMDVSPDGSAVLFSRTDRARELWEVPMAGGEPRQIVQDYGDSALFSPDGSRVMYRTSREVEGVVRGMHRVVAASNGEPQASLEIPAAGFDARWSPDGDALTYILDHNGVHNVVRQPLTGGPAEPITHFKEGRLQTHRWSPDGRRFLVIRWLGDADNLWSLRADGGDPVRLTDFATGHMFGAKWTPDGKNVVFGYGTASSDVVLIRDQP